MCSIIRIMELSTPIRYAPSHYISRTKSPLGQISSQKIYFLFNFQECSFHVIGLVRQSVSRMHVFRSIFINTENLVMKRRRMPRITTEHYKWAVILKMMKLCKYVVSCPVGYQVFSFFIFICHYKRLLALTDIFSSPYQCI